MMPYDIVKRKDKWCVVRLKVGNKPQKTIACHNSKDKAEKQLHAIQAAEHGTEGDSDE